MSPVTSRDWARTCQLASDPAVVGTRAESAEGGDPGYSIPAGVPWLEAWVLPTEGSERIAARAACHDAGLVSLPPRLTNPSLLPLKRGPFLTDQPVSLPHRGAARIVNQSHQEMQRPRD
jgi:hypothetical protein